MNDIETFAELTIQRVNDVFKKHSRNWLIAFGLAVIILIILLVVVFRKTKENETLPILQEQQKKLDELIYQQQQSAEQDRLRDSVFYENYVRNSAQRESQISNEKKKANEIIDRITDPAFNADSIRRWWANN